MKKEYKYSVLPLMSIIIFFTILIPILGQEVSIEQQQEKLKQIENRKNSIQQEIERLKREETDHQKSLNNIQNLLETAENELKSAQESHQRTLLEIKKMEEELEIEENKLELQLIILKNRLKKFYKYNNISYLSVLLDSQDFSQFLNRFQYLECILENDADIIRQVDEQVEFVRKQRDSLNNKKEITLMLEEEIKKEKENITLSLETKNKYIARIDDEKKKQIAILEELEKSSVHIMEIIQKAILEREKARKLEQQSIATARKENNKEIALQVKKGIFQLPVKGNIISEYGAQKQQELNALIFNSGIDISASLGEAVRSASFGSVIYTGNVKGYGDIIILDHGGSVVTLYAHLSKVLVDLNDQVNKGQIIGQVGTSGGAPSPRLHFEVRVDGKPVNPFEWL